MPSSRSDGADRDITRIERERGADGTVHYYWQLSAGNGRVLGRSPAVYPDRAAAGEACVALGRRVELLVVTVEHADAAAGWRWRISDPSGRDGGGRTVSMSARPFERYGSCVRAGQRMLAALAACAQRRV